MLRHRSGFHRGCSSIFNVGTHVLLHQIKQHIKQQNITYWKATTFLEFLLTAHCFILYLSAENNCLADSGQYSTNLDTNINSLTMCVCTEIRKKQWFYTWKYFLKKKIKGYRFFCSYSIFHFSGASRIII